MTLCRYQIQVCNHSKVRLSFEQTLLIICTLDSLLRVTCGFVLATLNVEFRSSLCCLILPAASCTGLWVQRGEQGIDLLDVWRWGGKEKREFFP